MTDLTLTGLSPAITFDEDTVNTSPQLIDTDVVFGDAGSGFNGGVLTLSGLLAEDRVSVRNQGTGAGQIGVSGTDITYGGVVIGYLAGGVGDMLTITFNASATAAAIDALIQNLTYANVSNAPTASRTFVLNVIDGSGNQLSPPATFGQDFSDGPFNSLDVGNNGSLTYADLDGDGDLDVLSGTYAGTLLYFENTGTATTPVLTQRTGAANPFDGINAGGYFAAPTLGDLDGDGDFDLLLANRYGSMTYFENIGGSGSPDFQEQTGSDNPLLGIYAGANASLQLADIDGDGDLDLLATGYGGHYGLRYFRNVGTASAPVFQHQYGGADPFDAVNFNGYSNAHSASLSDLDGDGDLDLVLGDGTAVRYFENTGSVATPNFAEQYGGDNPFDSVSLSNNETLSLVDLDGDGDADLVLADQDGNIRYFENSFVPPTTITINITAQNDAPTASGLPASRTLTEDTTTGLILQDLDISDDSASITVTFTASSGTLTSGSDGIVVVTGSGTGVLTFTGSPAAVDTMINYNSIIYTPGANVSGTGAATVTVTVDDGTGPVSAGTVTLNITAIDDQSSVSGFDASVTFDENTVNASPQVLDAQVSFIDADGDVASGSVTVSGLLAEDRLSVRNEGTGAGQIGLSGADVSYGGVVIGTLAGGSGSTLTITFNGAASAAAIDALLQNLTYANVSDTPTASRDLDIVIRESGGNDITRGLSVAQQTGATNPFFSLAVPGNNSSTFADIDNDGDLDVAIGSNFGTVSFFRNTGTASAPVFVAVTGASNPFAAVDVAHRSTPVLVDLDADGDHDLVVGNGDGGFAYYENTGTVSAPVFTQRTGAANPLSGFDLGDRSAPTFGDVDGDGDLDAFSGDHTGQIFYFENTGTASAAVFVQRTGTANPLNGVDVGGFSGPTLGDIDRDGDLDMLVGTSDGPLAYFENTGTTSAPVFTQRTGGANPFNGLNSGDFSRVAFADLDADGDPDFVVGEFNADVNYFLNTSVSAVRVTVTISSQNDAPTQTGLPTDVTVVEDAASNLDLSAVTLTDADNTGSMTVTLTASAGTMTAASGGGVTVSGSGTGTLVLTGTISAIDAFLNTASAVQYTGAANASGNDAATVTVSADDGSGAVTLGTVNVDITAVNDAMSLTGFGPSATFNENTVNATPQLLDIDVTFTDPDSFDGGALTITGVSANDRYSVRNEGTGAGQIGLSGANVSYGGVVIGTLAGGVGASLTITFNAAATCVAIDALIQNLTYANLSDTPNGNTSFTLNVTDASGRGLTGDASFQEISFFNPLSTLDVGYRSHPTFADLDGDGDLDAVVGTRDGILRYFENTGNGVTAAFTERSGAANPFDGILLDYNSAPTFGDLDGDGDQDLMLGGNNGQISYFENTGTAAAAVFTHRSGAQHPLNGVDVGSDSTPTLGDVDGDGDLDAVVGRYGGGIRYFENTGTAGAATFVERTGGANPFNGVSTGLYSVPGLVDLDGDGDLDAVITSEDGGVARYFENDGGAFTEQTGTDNPFNNVPVGFTPPAFFDRDGDGDLDLLLGDHGGTVRYLRNNTPIGQIFNIFITAQNDAPTAAGLPTDVTVTEDEASNLDLSSATLADGDSGNNPITVTLTAGAGTLTANSGGGVTVSGSGGGTLILTGTAANLDAFLNTASNIQYTGAANANGNNADTVTVTANDGQGSGTVTLGSVNIDITAVDDPMSLTDLDASVTFAENTVNAMPQLLDVDVTFTDPDNDFDGGTLTLSGLLAEDRASVRNEGTDPGQIGLSGTDVTFGGVVIGTLAGGVGNTLTITFNAAATSAALDALIQNLTYANVSNTPTASRILTLSVTDASGASFSDAPSFTQRSGAANPFDGIDTGSRNAPALADLDGDGDADMLVGDMNGTFRYFENTGTAAAPVFTERTGAANPFDGFDIGHYSRPTLADLDGDGDLDVVVGDYFGFLQYLENTGTALAPAFTHQIGSGNPFSGQSVGGYQSTPTLADLDGDGDLDAVIGELNGSLNYFENIGTAAAGIFSERTGAANPFDGLTTDSHGTPVLIDVDGDGDMDLVTGHGQGGLHYFENTGTAAAPVFVQRTGAANPFAGVDVGYISAPAFADLDGDGDLDIVIGDDNALLGYVENTTTPPDRTITVNVTAENDAPTVTDMVSSLFFTEGSAAVFIDSSVVFSDPELNLTGGSIVISGLVTSDSVQVAAGGSLTVVGSDILVSGVVIATQSGGIGGDLVISLTSNATPSSVEVLLESLTYVSSSVVQVAPHDLTVTVTDAGGAFSSTTVIVRFTDINDAPTLTGLVTSITFAENTVNATPQLLDSTVSLTDDEDNFDGGTLTLSGLLSEDRVSVRNEGTGAGQIGLSSGILSYGGVAIGTVAGGVGGTLTITFNASATAAAVDAVIQNLTYANVSDTPTASRSLVIDVVDAAAASLSGGPATITVNVTAQSDAINGTAAGETLTGAGAGDTVNGLGGNDLLIGGAGAQTLNGGDNDDTLRGAGGNDALNGGAGLDTADYSSAAAGVSVRLASNVTINDGDGGVDTLNSIENATGSAFNDTLFGSAGNNVLSGGLGADILLGLAGDDILIGGAGAPNTLQGGLGDDIYVVSANDTVTEFSGEGTDTVRTDRATYTLGSHLENLTHTGTGVFTGNGNGLANVMTGGSGRDTLNGLSGDDVLAGRGGQDTLTGGLGTDTADYSAAAAGISVRLAVNATLNDGDGSTDTLSGIENITGSAFADQIFGDANANVLNGGLGADTLLGLDGNDRLIGGAGASNTLQGGLGDDTYVVSANDTITELSGQGTDTVETDRGFFTLGSHVENLTFTGTGDFQGTGNSLANVITGGAGSDTLRGGLGDDTLIGGGGIDYVVLSGVLADYTVTDLGGGSYRIVDAVGGRDGTDVTSGVERVRFATGPTVTLASLAGSSGVPAGSGDKSGTGPQVLPGLSDDDFVMTKGGDTPEVLPGVDDLFRALDGLGLDTHAASPWTMLTVDPDGLAGHTPDPFTGRWDDSGWNL